MRNGASAILLNDSESQINVSVDHVNTQLTFLMLQYRFWQHMARVACEHPAVYSLIIHVQQLMQFRNHSGEYNVLMMLLHRIKPFPEHCNRV